MPPLQVASPSHSLLHYHTLDSSQCPWLSCWCSCLPGWHPMRARTYLPSSSPTSVIVPLSGRWHTQESTGRALSKGTMHGNAAGLREPAGQGEAPPGNPVPQASRGKRRELCPTHPESWSCVPQRRGCLPHAGPGREQQDRVNCPTSSPSTSRFPAGSLHNSREPG